MYICNACGKTNPFLIFEYNELVCEECSLHKNISNCRDLNEPFFLQAEGECDEAEEEEIAEEDAENLLSLLENIKNPRIREDFRVLAEEYIWGGDGSLEIDDDAA